MLLKSMKEGYVIEVIERETVKQHATELCCNHKDEDTKNVTCSKIHQ